LDPGEYDHFLVVWIEAIERRLKPSKTFISAQAPAWRHEFRKHVNFQPASRPSGMVAGKINDDMLGKGTQPSEELLPCRAINGLDGAESTETCLLDHVFRLDSFSKPSSYPEANKRAKPASAPRQEFIKGGSVASLRLPDRFTCVVR